MGVMACDRRDCKNVMCDRCILGNTMYICNECCRELAGYKDTWPESITKSQLKKLVEDFMESPVGTHVIEEPLSKDGVDEEFSRLMGRERD